MHGSLPVLIAFGVVAVAILSIVGLAILHRLESREEQ